MNFILSFLLITLLACLFLFFLGWNFTFRLIRKKLRWWILAHWGSTILVLLSKAFLLVSGLQVFQDLKFGGTYVENWQVIKHRKFLFELPWKTYQLGFANFIIFFLIAVLIHTQLAYLHMYLGYVLEDKIREYLINDSLNRYIKLPFLQSQALKGKLRNTLFFDIPLLSLYLAGGNKGQNFNQIFYQSVDAFLMGGIIINSLQNKQTFAIVVGALILTIILVVILQYLIVKKEKRFKKSSDWENKLVDNLLNNFDLLKKKELSEVFFQEIKKNVKKNTKKRTKDKFLIVANAVYPNQFLPNAIGMILFFFTLDIGAAQLTREILRKIKGVLVTTWDLPITLVSNQRLCYFYQLTKSPKLEKNSKVIFAEPIKKISMHNICYQYPNQNKSLLKDFSKEFVAGEVTKLEGGNGTGKSTTILLILGLLKPQKGQIIINDSYDLQDLDLENWRKQIAYASNQSLLKEGSEGEKQIQELEEVITKNNYSFYDKERQSKILMLDEAWSSMDRTNRERWKEKAEKLTKKNKIVTIVVEH